MSLNPRAPACWCKREFGAVNEVKESTAGIFLNEGTKEALADIPLSPPRK